MRRKEKTRNVKKACFLCVNNLKDVSFQDATVLKRFVSSYMKIAPRRRSGLCATHQRKAARAIKRAREMSLMPYLAR